MNRGTTLAFALLLSSALAASADVLEPIDEARAAATELGDTLRARLSSAMKDGGPAAAIGVCSREATEIAERISKSRGVTVRRTAARLRNPANAPDAWETAVLARFAATAKEGKPLPPEFAETRVESGKTVLRWAKPIVLGSMCLTCHGDPAAIPEKVRTAIAAAYPADAATGFAEGDLRGIFSVTVPVGAGVKETPAAPASGAGGGR